MQPRCSRGAAEMHLHEDLVLVHRNERAEGARVEAVEHERVGRLVAWEDLGKERTRTCEQYSWGLGPT